MLTLGILDLAEKPSKKLKEVLVNTNVLKVQIHKIISLKLKIMNEILVVVT